MPLTPCLRSRDRRPVRSHARPMRSILVGLLIAVTLWLPAVNSVTKNVPVPLVSGEGGGTLADPVPTNVTVPG